MWKTISFILFLLIFASTVVNYGTEVPASIMGVKEILTIIIGVPALWTLGFLSGEENSMGIEEYNRKYRSTDPVSEGIKMVYIKERMDKFDTKIGKLANVLGYELKHQKEREYYGKKSKKK